MHPEHQHLIFDRLELFHVVARRGWRTATHSQTSRLESEVFRELPDQLPNQSRRGRGTYRAPANAVHPPKSKRPSNPK